MQYELLVTLQLELAHHFIERCPAKRAPRFEPPPTLGTTKAAEILLLDPYQLPAHGRLCRCIPTLSDCMPRTRLPSRDKVFSFRNGVLPEMPKPSPDWAGAKDAWSDGEVYTFQFGPSVGHPTYMGSRCSWGTSRFRGPFERSEAGPLVAFGGSRCLGVANVEPM
jgi:hypothetical protein